MKSALLSDNVKRKQSLKGLIPYITAALTSACMITVVCIINGLAPFGDKSMFIIDLNGQYIDFFSYLHSMSAENNSVFYSFSTTLGSNTMAFAAYYLMSPFNVVFLLFSPEHFDIAFFIVLTLKLCACTVTSLYFLRNFENAKAFGWGFAVAYAFISYNISFYYNIMWLDGVALLPLVALGIIRIVRGEKPFLYILSLCAALVIECYIGYMLCVFSVLFFFCLMIAKRREKPGVKILVFSGTSVLSGGVGALWLIPVFFAIKGGKFAPEAATGNVTYPFYQLMAKFFTGAHDYNQSLIGIPAVFCGICTVLFVFLYFLNRRISLRERAAAAFICVFMIISFHSYDLNLFWHAMNKPHCFNFRYSFIFSFILIFLAVRGLRRLRGGVTLKTVCISSGIFLLMAQAVSAMKLTYIKPGFLYIDFAIVLITAVFLLLTQKTRLYKTVLPVLIAVVTVINCYQNTVQTMEDFKFTPYEDYTEQTSKTDTAIDALKKYDCGFYRTEKTYYRNQNDEMQSSYNGLSHFSSVEKTFVKDFMGKLGFRNHNYWAHYDKGSTEGADCLLGVKYLLSEGIMYRPYDYVTETGDITVYENPNALPLGFVGGEPFEAELNDGSPFVNLNSIFRALSGQSRNIYTPVRDFDIRTYGLEMNKNGRRTVYFDSTPNSTPSSSIVLSIPVTSENPIYMYITSPGRQNVKLYVNGESRGDYLDTYHWSVVSLGKYNIGDTVTVRLETTAAKTEIYDFLFCYEDTSLLYDICTRLKSNGCFLKKESSRRITGTVNSDGGYLTFTFPYDNGWKLYIDGKRTELKKAFGALMTAKISRGEHTLKLVFTPEGLVPGCIVSFLCITAVTAWAVYRKKRIK